METAIAWTVIAALCAPFAALILAAATRAKLPPPPPPPPTYDPGEFPYSLAMLARVHQKTAGRYMPEQVDAPHS